MYVVYVMFTEKSWRKEVCDNIESKDPIEIDSDKFPSEKECEQKLVDQMGIALAIFFFLQIIIQTHFGMVLFTHWKNSNLPESMGGLIPMAPRE